MQSLRGLTVSLSRCRPSTSAGTPHWSVWQMPVRNATSKAGGSTKNGRDSNPQYLGVKKYGGQYVEPGNIIIRQRGQKFGIVDSTATVAFGKDYTIYALKPGFVKFWHHRLHKKRFVEVVQSLPGPNGEGEVVKYPICKLKAWEFGPLARIVDSAAAAGKQPPSMTPEIEAGLAAWRAERASHRSSGGFLASKGRAEAAATRQAAAAAAPAAEAKVAMA